MSWTYKTWTTDVQDIGNWRTCRIHQVKDKWIPPWHFNEEKKLWEPVPGGEYPPTENNNGSDSTTTT